MIQATPIRMPDGAWEARVDGVEDLKAGDRVELISRRGEAWSVEVIQVLDSYRCVHRCKVRRI